MYNPDQANHDKELETWYDHGHNFNSHHTYYVCMKKASRRIVNIFVKPSLDLLQDNHYKIIYIISALFHSHSHVRNRDRAA